MKDRLTEKNRRRRTEAIALEAARTLGESGCFRLRVDEVAERAGVAKGTVYLSFSDKRELVASAYERASRALLDGLAERLSGIDDPKERLRAALEYLAEMCADHPEFDALLDGRLACSTTWMGVRASAVDAIGSRFEELIRLARGSGSIAAGVDPAVAAQLVIAISRTAAWREDCREPRDIFRQVSLVGDVLASIWPDP